MSPVGRGALVVDVALAAAIAVGGARLVRLPTHIVHLRAEIGSATADLRDRAPLLNSYRRQLARLRAAVDEFRARTQGALAAAPGPDGGVIDDIAGCARQQGIFARRHGEITERSLGVSGIRELLFELDLSANEAGIGEFLAAIEADEVQLDLVHLLVGRGDGDSLIARARFRALLAGPPPAFPDPGDTSPAPEADR